MDHAYVINLDSRRDRWHSIQKHFKGSNIKLHRFSAVKKSPGAYGLLLTAIKVLETAKRRQHPAIIMMEDDCLPTMGWKSRWETIKTWLANHTDIWDIYNGGVSYYKNLRHVGSASSIEMFSVTASYGAHWVYIPMRSYDKLLTLYKNHIEITHKNPSIGIDIINGSTKMIISTPFIAYQSDGHSNIKNTTRSRIPTFKHAEKLLRKTRRNK